MVNVIELNLALKRLWRWWFENVKFTFVYFSSKKLMDLKIPYWWL